MCRNVRANPDTPSYLIGSRCGGCRAVIGGGQIYVRLWRHVEVKRKKHGGRSERVAVPGAKVYQTCWFCVR